MNQGTTSVQIQKKILVAGSAKEVVETIVLLLKKTGCSTDIALTGPEVITKSVQFSPDIIAMDIQMDGMSSNEVIKVLRRMPQSEEKPIIVFSYFSTHDLGSASIREKALGIDAAHSACMEAGATKYIERFSEHTFIEKIKPYLHASAKTKKGG